MPAVDYSRRDYQVPPAFHRARALGVSMPADQSSETAKQRLSPRAVWLGLSVLLLVASVLAWSAWAFQAHARLGAARAKLEAQGEKLSFADFEPAPARPDKNGAHLFLQAMAHAGLKDLDLNALHAAVYSEPAPAADDPLWKKTVEQCAWQLSEFRRAVAAPRAVFPLDYHIDFPICLMLPHIEKWRAGQAMLHAQSTHALATDDHALAVDTAQTTLLFGELFREEPLLISQLVRYRGIGSGIDSLCMLLGQMELTADERADFDKRLAQLESRICIAPALRGERASLLTTLAYLGKGSRKSIQAANLAGVRVAGVELIQLPFLRPVLLHDETDVLIAFQALIEASDVPGRQGQALRDGANKLATEQFRGLLPSWGQQSMPAVDACANASFAARQRLVLARLALRIDASFRAQGTLPSNLNEIVDEVFPAMPVGLGWDEPLVYLVLPPDAEHPGPRFKLRTLGNNGQDDGGDLKVDPTERAQLEVDYSVP